MSIPELPPLWPVEVSAQDDGSSFMIESLACLQDIFAPFTDARASIHSECNRSNDDES